MLGIIGFIRPTILLCIPAVLGFLIYAYLRRGKHNARKLSTLLLLKDFQSKVPKRAKITIPRRFYFELCVLSLLILAASGLYLLNSGKRIAFIYDNSLSTAAMSSTHGNLSRYLFEEAQSSLSELSSFDSIDLFITNAAEKNRKNLSPSEVEAALYHVEPEYGADGLDRLLAETALGGYDKIISISDKSASSEHNSAFEFFPQNPITDVVNNIAIERALLREEGADRAIIATLRSFSTKDTKVIVQVTSIGREGGNGSQTKSSVVLPSGQSISTRIAVGSDNAAGYTISLSFESKLDDQLELDNKYYLSSDAAQSEELVFVGDLDPSTLHIDQIKRYAVRGIKPDDYDAFSSSHKPLLYIFHRTTPDNLPNRSALFIAPPRGERLFSIHDDYTNLTLSRWLQSHPLTNYLNLSLLVIPTASIISPPPWQDVVLSTPEGPVLTAGETAGNRYAVSGFELLPFKGKDSPFLSILTLNLLTWLSEKSDSLESPDALVNTSHTNFFDSSESDLKDRSLLVPLAIRSISDKASVAGDGKSTLIRMGAFLVLMLLILDILYLIRKRRFVGQAQT